MTLAINGTTGITLAGQFDSASTFGYRNRIINGGMVIDQRNAGAAISAATLAAGLYTVDRWAFAGSQSAKFSAQQNQGSVTPPSTFKNYLGLTSASAYTLISNDYFQLVQVIEGYNIADLGWGTANASPATLSFWVYSSLTGTFGGSIATNKTSVWVLPFSYTVSSANTWTYITVAIPATSSATPNTDNLAGVFVRFGLGSTGTSAGGTAGVWTNAGNYIQPASTVSVVSTNGATFYVTGVQLEKGSTATSFDYRPYGTELTLCQRYCVAFDNRAGTAYYNFGIAIGQSGSTTTAFANMTFPVTMRSKPSSITLSAANTFLLDPSNNNFTSVQIDQSSPQVGGLYFTGGTGGVGNAAGRFLSLNTAAAYAIWSAEL